MIQISRENGGQKLKAEIKLQDIATSRQGDIHWFTGIRHIHCPEIMRINLQM